MAEKAIKVELKLVKQSEKAICCTRKDGEDIWLPKSQILYDQEAEEGDMIDVDVAEWLIKEKGLE